MTTPSQPAFPRAAVDWLFGKTVSPAGRLLILRRGSAPLAAELAASGHRLVVSDTSRAGVRPLLHRAAHALPVVADPGRLPFVPTAFDAVAVHQSLHTLPLETALPEIARVLKPGGHLGISFTIRDDSVPWVRRLTALIRSVDPNAMTGDYGMHAVDAVTESPFFPEIERRNHRLWVPISRVDLLAMVASRFPDLDAERRGALMAEVGALYESSARAPQPLLLPYQVACWRAAVDHTEFTSQLRLPDDGLTIPL